MAVLQLSIILYYDTLKILKSGLDRGPIIKDIPPEDRELIHKMIEAREKERSSKMKGHSTKGGR